jgi:hypothetical protein
MRQIQPIRISLISPFKRGRRYNFVTRLHALFISVGVRCALALGYVVVMVGACRSGKSVALNQALRGRIIDKRAEGMHGYRPGL